MLEDNDNIWDSVGKFSIANPDYNVKVEVGISEEDSVTRTDAIKKLNTELMAGEGPGVIFLDGLPIEIPDSLFLSHQLQPELKKMSELHMFSLHVHMQTLHFQTASRRFLPAFPAAHSGLKKRGVS